MTKNFWILAVALVVLGFLYSTTINKDNNIMDESSITSFEECVAAGNPVKESYPEQCRTKGGKHFVREIDKPIEPPITPPQSEDDVVFCTADAMQCPDGTWVGRTGPNCQFVCPD